MSWILRKYPFPYSSLLFFCIASTALHAQNFAVQTFLQVSPPYTSYLPDYSDPMRNPMSVFITLQDFQVPSHDVTLRFRIEGNGWTIQSSPYYIPDPITIYPGVPIQISGDFLAPYLSSQNLQFDGIDVSDYERRKVLPEGPVTICVEVIDYLNTAQTIVGNTACTQLWLSRQQPPMLNLPQCGSTLDNTLPQQILFSWTPMHMGNPLALTGTEYSFELFEVRPAEQDPNQVVNTSLPIFSTTLFNQTTLSYGILEPILVEGLEYVWRVKASDLGGRDWFSNQGYSQVCAFKWGDPLNDILSQEILTLQASGTGNRQGQAWWNASNIFTEYELQYRKTGNPDYHWFTIRSTNALEKMNSLEEATEYECRVKGLVGIMETDWSNTVTFATQPPREYGCGSTILPATGNFTALQPSRAGPGLFVQVGQFEVFTSSMSSVSSGRFSGEGTVIIDFVGTRVNVEFDDLQINDDLNATNGLVQAKTRGIDAWYNEHLQDQYQDSAHFINSDLDEDDFTVSDSTLTIITEDSTYTFTFPADDRPITILDNTGTVWTIFPDGTIISESIEIEQLARSERLKVDFLPHEDQRFGLDTYTHEEWKAHYEKAIQNSDELYFIPWKSLQEGESDKVIAHLTDLDGISGAISFRTPSGDSIPHQSRSDGDYDLTLPAREEYSVLAYSDSLVIGKLNVLSYEEVTKKVVIVPVLNATLSDMDSAALTQGLNGVYAQAVCSWQVQVADNFSSSTWDSQIPDGKLEVPNDDNARLYSTEMRALRDDYFSSHQRDPDAFYVFVVPSFSNTAVQGYMVRGKQVGFLAAGESLHTLAHELSHGGYGLEHSFEEGGPSRNSTQNLMDYSGGQLLVKFQWDEMRRTIVISMFDEWENGLKELMSKGDLTLAIDEGYELSTTRSNSAFFTPTGKAFRLPDNYTRFTLNKSKGYLSQFSVGAKDYHPFWVVDAAMHDQIIGFAGYMDYDEWVAFDDERNAQLALFGQNRPDIHDSIRARISWNLFTSKYYSRLHPLESAQIGDYAVAYLLEDECVQARYEWPLTSQDEFYDQSSLPERKKVQTIEKPENALLVSSDPLPENHLDCWKQRILIRQSLGAELLEELSLHNLDSNELVAVLHVCDFFDTVSVKLSTYYSEKSGNLPAGLEEVYKEYFDAQKQIVQEDIDYEQFLQDLLSQHQIFLKNQNELGGSQTQYYALRSLASLSDIELEHIKLSVRLNALKAIVSEDMSGGDWFQGDEESDALRLISHLRQEEICSFHKALEDSPVWISGFDTQSLLEALLNRYDDYFGSDNNYFTLVSTLISQSYQRFEGNDQQLLAMMNDVDQNGHIITFGAAGKWNLNGGQNQLLTVTHSSSDYDAEFQTDRKLEIIHQNIQWEFGGLGTPILWVSVDDLEKFKIKPLTGFVMVHNFDEDIPTSGWPPVVPAITVKYLDDASFQDRFWTAVDYATNVISLASGTWAISAGARGLKLMAAVLDVVNSITALSAEVLNELQLIDAALANNIKFVTSIVDFTGFSAKQSKALLENFTPRFQSVAKRLGEVDLSGLSSSARQQLAKLRERIVGLVGSAPAHTPLIPADAWKPGWSMERVLGIPKNSRPAPTEYLTEVYISNHISRFQHEGIVSRIVSKDAYLEFGVGKPDVGKTEFVALKSEIDDILDSPIQIQAEKLGIPASQLERGGLVRIDFNVSASRQVQMPSGNEWGANDQWIPGGKTDGGVSEAILKTEGMQLNVDYVVHDL